MRTLTAALLGPAALVPSVVATLAVGAPAAATALPSCSFAFGLGSVTAICDWPAYRVVAECSDTRGTWSVRGNPASAGRGGSTARCGGQAKVVDYRVATARLLPPGCASVTTFPVIDGEGVRAVCQGRYRVVAYCETLLVSWYVFGTVALPGQGGSEAVCHAGELTGYYVELV
ncbi:MAG: hypothetical protein JOZ47_12640 [Kutzneria sp.]|nr:hypothetical protein [Kutzneria sp.]